MIDKLPANFEAQLFQAIAHQSGNAIWVENLKGTILIWGQSAVKIFGYEEEAVIGGDGVDVLGEQVEKFRQDPRFEARLKRADGKLIWVLVSTIEAKVDGESYFIFSARSLEHEKEREAELIEAATTDPLSGLMNRREFQRRLEAAVSSPLALAIIDLDNFKVINDVYGHPVGDEAISVVAKCMADVFPKEAALARLGGDEFGLVLPMDVGQDIRTLFERFGKLLSETKFHGGRLSVTASVGVAISQNGNATPRDLLSSADKTMYSAKQGGRNRVSFCEID